MSAFKWTSDEARLPNYYNTGDTRDPDVVNQRIIDYKEPNEV